MFSIISESSVITDSVYQLIPDFFFQLEEFLPIYSQAKKDKDQGQYEDFLECLKLYDKNENGLMLGAELTHTLLALGNICDNRIHSDIIPNFESTTSFKPLKVET